MLDGIWSLVKSLLETLAVSNSTVAQVLVVVVGVVGTVRLVMKPIMTALRAIADATPSDNDNKLLDSVEQSPFYKTMWFLLDYIFSIKPPIK